MSLSGEEIQRALQHFAARWHGYAGSERGEAQTFLNELFACYGVERREVGAEFEDAHSSAGIMDLHWPGRVIFEMKAPSRSDRLAEHRKQAIDYWRHSASVASGTPAPPYVVLCGFHRFEVWEPGRFPEEPRVVVDLGDLSDRYEALLFLAGEEPLFIEQRRDLSVAAARAMNALYLSLLDRSAAEPAVLRDFMLQSVWCFFAESLKLLPEHSIERIVEGLVENPHRSSAAELGFLFDALNQTEPSAKGGVYTGIPYANGGLFADPARVHLERAELELYAEALRYDWRQVNPTIFGSILEGSLGDRRSELGIHYTHESDIMKIVGPTIVEPWTDRIASASTPDEAERALADLRRFRVLDPACGCGNFLYVAYRELRSLEQTARRRISDTYEAAGAEMPDVHRPGYPLANLHGIEVDEFAVGIARVVLWMGHKLAADRYGLVETVLPLVALSNVVQGDALKVAWPEVSAIIGNPPFLGSQHLRGSLGDDYVDWVKNEFGCGLKDFCVYWFRRAADNLGPGCRAGLVGTNSVSQNRARSASLEFLVERGGVITNAVSSQKWPGEAKVHVSIVNWVHKPDPAPDRFVLDGVEVSGITTALRAGLTRPEPSSLPANRGRAFQGPIPVGDGFMVEQEEARSLLARSDADYSSVVRRFLSGGDIVTDPAQEPTRWIIDFSSMALEDAMQYPAALAIVRERVKPERDQNRSRARREYWWLFGARAVAARSAITGLSRFLAANAVGKRLMFCWAKPEWTPNNKTNVFAFDDGFTFGVLSSAAHTAWAWEMSSTLKADLNYTPTTAFETFPFPYPIGDEQRNEVAGAGREVLRLRREHCAADEIGLTPLYNRLDDGAYSDLRRGHRALDEAVVASYGWPRSIAQDHDELVSRLLEHDRQIASGERQYDPFPPAALPDSQQSLL